MQVANFLDAKHEHWAAALVPHLFPSLMNDEVRQSVRRLKEDRESDGDSDGEPYSPVATPVAAPAPFTDEPSAKRRCKRLRGRRPATRLDVWRALFQKLPEAFLHSLLREQGLGHRHGQPAPLTALAATPPVLLFTALHGHVLLSLRRRRCSAVLH